MKHNPTQKEKNKESMSFETSEPGQEEPWREASSLIVAAKCSTTEDKTNYKLLLTKRSGRSSYLANAYCFPGGHIELADFSADWYQVFEKSGHNRQAIDALANSVTGPRSPIIADPLALKNLDKNKYLPAAIGLRIAAIRETFEEAGLLIACNNISAAASRNDWQKKVHQDATTFVQLFLELGSCPDIWSLKEWWNWLTPEAMGHKRFDTIFYLCCLDSLPKTTSDEAEVSGIDWLTPQQVLRLHNEGTAFLAPPQVYELARIANFAAIDHLSEFSANREQHGIERWCSKITGLHDGALLALPGDDFYGTVVNANSNELPTLQDTRNSCKTMNRLELRAPVFTPICVQLSLPCGHVVPIAVALPDDDSEMEVPALQSQL